MRETLLQLFLDTLEDASLHRVMASKVERRGGALIVDGSEVDVAGARRIFVAAIGKAAWPMCQALLPSLPAGTSGAVVAPVPVTGLPAGFRGFCGGHPFPNEESQTAARYVAEAAESLDDDDLFLCLLSGGGSALCEAALYDQVSLSDLRAFYEVLVTCGGNIVEMNVLRKHFSLIKGGRLGVAAAPARQLTLYVSDVPPGEPSSVASGPTMPDESTCADARGTAADLDVLPRLPASVRTLLEDSTLDETPKPGDAAFARSQWICLLDNSAALENLEARARGFGWTLERDETVDDRPVEEVADTLVGRLEALARNSPGKTVAVTAGGELSSPVKGDGLGGRNQAFVLWAARKIAERGLRASVLSAGTDGIDGNSPAAGAFADHTTVPRAEALGMDAADFERRSDSYRYFERLGDLIVTGPTGNNVRDVRMLVAEPANA